MRNALFLLLAACSLAARSEMMFVPAAVIVKPSTEAPTAPDRLREVDAAAFLEMDRADFESITGKRMTFAQRFRFNRLQHRVGKDPSTYSSESLVQLAEADNRKMHWANIVALCCGGVAFLTGFFSVPAVVFGAIGLSKSGPTKQFKGRGFAIAGMAAGILGVAYWLIAVVGL